MKLKNKFKVKNIKNFYKINKNNLKNNKTKDTNKKRETLLKSRKINNLNILLNNN